MCVAVCLNWTNEILIDRQGCEIVLHIIIYLIHQSDLNALIILTL